MERHSMAWRTKDYSDVNRPVVKEYELRYSSNQTSFQLKDSPYHSEGPKYRNGTEKDPNKDLENIIPLDGRQYRRVITINGEFPGPVIRVKKGSVVKVVVYNHMDQQAATVHWHGILQKK